MYFRQAIGYKYSLWLSNVIVAFTGLFKFQVMDLIYIYIMGIVMSLYRGSMYRLHSKAFIKGSHN